MGHLHHLKREYRALARRLERAIMPMPVPEEERARQAHAEILAILFSPEEAALAARLPHVPTSLPRLCALLGLPEAELEPRLQRMCERGLVMDATHPRSGIERAPGWAVQRGLLGELVFDQAGRGGRFLAAVLDALLALPPAQWALADPQLRSRFVRALLASRGQPALTTRRPPPR